MNGYEFFANPWTQVGMGILGGNVGASSSDAFANAMRSGLQGAQTASWQAMQRGQSEIQNQLLRQQIERENAEMERQRRMRAMAPGLMAGLQSPDPDVQAQAQAGLMEVQPDLMGQLLLNQMKSAQQETWRTLTPEETQKAGFKPGQVVQESETTGKFRLPGSGGVNINMAPKLPTGYRWVDPADPTAGVERLPGMQEPEATKKGAAIANEQQRLIGDLIEDLTDEQGNLSAGTLLKLRTPGTTLNNLLGRIAQNEVYIKSGAAASEGERQTTLSSIQPSITQILFGSDADVLEQLERARQFAEDVEMGSSLEQEAPTMATMENPATVANDADYEELKVGDYYVGPDGVLRQK